MIYFGELPTFSAIHEQKFSAIHLQNFSAIHERIRAYQKRYAIKHRAFSSILLFFRIMELRFPSFPVFLIFLLFAFIVVKKLKRSKAKNSAPKLPPGPWKLPFIGNIHQLVGSLPHHYLRELAIKHGPLMHLQLGEVSTVVVSSPEIAKEVMKTHDIVFAQRPFLLAAKIMAYNSSGLIFSPYGDYWRQLRKICMMELLSAKRVQSFHSIREEEVSYLIRAISLKETTSVNLSKKLFSMTYGIISRAASGRKCKDQEELISVIKEVTQLAGGFSVADLYPSVELLALISGMRPKLEKLHQEVDRILENIINEHKESLPATKTGKGEAEEDLIDVLLKIQERGDLEFPLNDNNIKAVILDIFSAGSETSSTVVEWAMSEMLKDPRVMKKARAEVRQVFDGKESVDETSLHDLKYLKSVIKETLRLHPSAPLISRECGERCEINGYEIPMKTKVLINAWAIGRDPEYWSEAERFYPERFLDSSIDYKGTDFEYIPFGSGRRICPGISFALANIELPLAQLLYHFDWKLPDGMKEEDLDMTEAFGMAVRKKRDLFLVPIPYHPLPAE